MRPALLIIDVQQAFCAGPHRAFDIVGVIERINDVAARARKAGMPVVLVQHESAGGALARGSAGWQLAHDLAVEDTDILLPKQAPDAFHGTDLHALLQARGVTRLVICGAQSDFCVDTTTRRALALGYPVTLVADGHTTLDNAVLKAAQITAHHNLTLTAITSYGVRAVATPAAQWLPETQPRSGP